MSKPASQWGKSSLNINIRKVPNSLTHCITVQWTELDALNVYEIYVNFLLDKRFLQLVDDEV